MRHHRPTQAGLTLIELVLVMGLLAVVLGAGLGSLAGLNPGERAAVGVVQDALRSAHNSAVSRTATARVRIDPVNHTLVSEGLEVMGTWHFESNRLEGVEGIDGTFLGMDPAVSPDGWIGNGLDFAAAGRGAEVEFPIQEDPAFDLSLGFAIDLWIKPREVLAAKLYEIPDVVQVELTKTGGVKARLFRASAESVTGMARKGAGLTIESESGLLRPDEWVHLRVAYDRAAARIYADGILVGSELGDFNLWHAESPIILGSRSTNAAVVVDELVISVVTASEEAELPGDVQFKKGAPTVVQFAAGGALDPLVHLGPVEIPLVFPSGKEDMVRVGFYGTVE